jgi:hypothetical protein
LSYEEAIKGYAVKKRKEKGILGERQKLIINPLALELDIYTLAHRLCKM